MDYQREEHPRASHRLSRVDAPATTGGAAVRRHAHDHFPHARAPRRQSRPMTDGYPDVYPGLIAGLLGISTRTLALCLVVGVPVLSSPSGVRSWRSSASGGGTPSRMARRLLLLMSRHLERRFCPRR